MVATNTHIYLFDPMMPFVDENGEVVKNGFINVFLAGTSTRVNTYANYGGTLNPINIPLDDSGRVKNPVIVPIDYNYKVALMDDGHDLQNPIKTFDNINCSKVVNNTGSITQGLNSADNTDGQFELTVTDNKLTVNGKYTYAKKSELTATSDALSAEVSARQAAVNAEASARAAADADLSARIDAASGSSASHEYVQAAVAAEAVARTAYVDGKVPNAPSSGAYVLKATNGSTSWSVQEGGIPEAPQDGKQYVRKDGEWSDVATSISSAVAAEAAVREGIDVGLMGYINQINNKIPEEATGMNQLADKAYVDDAIPTVDQEFSASSTNAQSGVAIAGKNWVRSTVLTNENLNDIVGETGAGISFYRWNSDSEVTGVASSFAGKDCYMEVRRLGHSNGDIQQDVYVDTESGFYCKKYTRRRLEMNWGSWVETTIPTKTSELTNDSGFITSSDVPTKTSELTNDSGFVVSSGITTIQVVDELPAEPVATTLYLIRE